MLHALLFLDSYRQDHDPVQLVYLLAVLAALIVMRKYGRNRNNRDQ